MKAQAIFSDGGCCTPQTTLAEASWILRDRDREWLPLIGQEGKVVDAITDRDIYMAIAHPCLPDMPIADAMAAAIAVVRGNPTLRTPLTNECTEPYVVPKRSLIGSTIERVDTRVMHVVYSFETNPSSGVCGATDGCIYSGSLRCAAVYGVTGIHSWHTLPKLKRSS